MGREPNQRAGPVKPRGSLVSTFAASCLALSLTVGFAQSSQRFVNGGFEDGLKQWQFSGDVHLETNNPVDGKASVLFGPGAGSLSQRIEVPRGNDFTASAIIQSTRTNSCVFALRFLDEHSREVMKVDSASDIQPDKKDPRKFNHYMKAHPLTKWIEIVISKDASEGSILVDQVGLELSDENAADLHSTCDLDQAMQPFWLGKKVYNE